jgi:hypothetical protein
MLLKLLKYQNLLHGSQVTGAQQAILETFIIYRYKTVFLTALRNFYYSMTVTTNLNAAQKRS